MNIVIDGNAFLNVSASIVKAILLKDKRVGANYWVSDLFDEDKYSLKQVSKDTFRDFSINYLGSIFAPFKDNISSVFFVFDSKSWRKQFVIQNAAESNQEDFAYKGKRKYENQIYLFFEYFQTEILKTISEEYGIVVNRVQGAEGDDLIAYICEQVKEDICIWTVDRDLVQLLEAENRKVILLMPKQMTKFKKIFTTVGFDQVEEPVANTDVFNFGFDQIDAASSISAINQLIAQKDYKHFIVDPGEEVLLKILSGDGSDSIPRIHQKMTASKVTKALEKIRQGLDSKNILNLLDSSDPGFINHIYDVTYEILKINDPGERQTLQHKINRNTRLVRLNTVMFPPEVLESIRSSVNISSRRRFNYHKFKKNHKR